ncbi:MAG: hypothetical protein KDI11_05395 [Alphaproteobacteria bacterium]|nr:hypothetical protein [Alphaproteobacteria bacterium]
MSINEHKGKWLKHRRLNALRIQLIQGLEKHKRGLRPDEVRALQVTSDHRPAYPQCFSRKLLEHGIIRLGLKPEAKGHHAKPNKFSGKQVNSIFQLAARMQWQSDEALYTWLSERLRGGVIAPRTREFQDFFI